MKTVLTTLLILGITISSAKAQEKAKIIFRYGEQVNIKADTSAQVKKITGTYTTNKVYLNWLVYNNTKPGIYVIERAADGKDFEVIGFKKGIPSTVPVDLSFYYTDNNPATDKAVYKITHIADDNTYFEFPAVTVKSNSGAPANKKSITASNEKPNPAPVLVSAH